MAGDVPRWDAEAQRWHQGEKRLAYVPPPPPRPQFAPKGSDPDSRREVTRHADPYPGQPGPAQLGRPQIIVFAVVAVLAVAGITTWVATTGGDDRSEGKSGSSGAPSTPYEPDTETWDPSTESIESDGVSESVEPSEPPSDALSESPSDSPSESMSPTAGSDAGTPGAPPAGYRVAADAKGFSLGVPEGWTRSSTAQGVFYHSPDKLSLLQIFTVGEGGMTSLQAVEVTSVNVERRSSNFRELSIGSVRGGPENPAGDAAELHYAYDDAKTVGVRECIERVFTAKGGTMYAVLGCAPDDRSPFQRELLTTALNHFSPGWS
ncbi:hypothetical protein [Streptomyces sp. NPDC020965]|uniref:hypothetical protein n=1 Tax=Streptomyces sp. NPDC020965 TaxID=3365105 RepID=UPI0037AB6BCA